MATTGGYTSKGDFQDQFGNVSAFGTAKDFLGMPIGQQMEVMGVRGIGGATGIGKSIADQAVVDALADFEKDVDIEALVGLEEPEFDATEEPPQQEEEEEDDETVDATEEAPPETEAEGGYT